MIGMVLYWHNNERPLFSSIESTWPLNYSSKQAALDFCRFFQICQKNLKDHRNDYEKLCNVGQELLKKWGEEIRCKKIMQDITTKWTAINTRLAGSQQHLEMFLKEWQEYTSLMENIMVWMREKEKQLRRPLVALSLREVENELEKLKVNLPFTYLIPSSERFIYKSSSD